MGKRNPVTPYPFEPGWGSVTPWPRDLFEPRWGRGGGGVTGLHGVTGFTGLHGGGSRGRGYGGAWGGGTESTASRGYGVMGGNGGGGHGGVTGLRGYGMHGGGHGVTGLREARGPRGYRVTGARGHGVHGVRDVTGSRGHAGPHRRHGSRRWATRRGAPAKALKDYRPVTAHQALPPPPSPSHPQGFTFHGPLQVARFHISWALGECAAARPEPC